MRQREKRKERREQRKRVEQDKLVQLEEKKLSRREWLMAQPEVNKLISNIQTIRAGQSTLLHKKMHSVAVRKNALVFFLDSSHFRW